MTAIDVDARLLRQWPLPQPAASDDKEARGRVLAVGGSREVPGAVLLAGVAALRVGAGKLRLATVESAAVQLAVAVPEARVYSLAETNAGAVAAEAATVVADAARDVDAVVLGPGMADAGAIAHLLDALASRARPAVVLDAGALLCLDDPASALRGLHDRVVLTPNEAEWQQMGGASAAAYARAHRAVVTVKGATTVTYGPDGDEYVDHAGNPGLGTSGSGDVVAGAVAGLLARGAAPLQATVWANHLHAVAGDRLARRMGRIGFLAREIGDELPAVLDALSCRDGR